MGNSLNEMVVNAPDMELMAGYARHPELPEYEQEQVYTYIATRAFQYMMIIFLLPFLILSGYMSNYDLISGIRQLLQEKVPST